MIIDLTETLASCKYLQFKEEYACRFVDQASITAEERRTDKIWGYLLCTRLVTALQQSSLYIYATIIVHHHMAPSLYVWHYLFLK